MNEERPEVLRFGLHLCGEGYLSAQLHVDRIDIEQPWAFCEQEHSPTREKTLLLVDQARLQDEVVLYKSVELVVASLDVQSALADSLVREFF